MQQNSPNAPAWLGVLWSRCCKRCRVSVPHGGYRLGRPARLIKVADAITVGLNSLEESVHDLSGQLHRMVIEPLWAEFDAALLATADSLTIEDLLKRAAKAGLRKPVTDPLNFVI